MLFLQGIFILVITCLLFVILWQWHGFGLAVTGTVPVVVSIASDVAEARWLVESARRLGYGTRVEFLVPSSVGKFEVADKLALLARFLQTRQPHELIVFADAYDTAFLGGPAEFLRKFNQLSENGRRIVFSAERNCWPVWDLAAAFPPDPSSPAAGRFLNSGLFAGTAAKLRQLLIKRPKYSMDDQLFYTLQFLANHPDADIVLDYEAALFQSMWDADDRFTTVVKNDDESTDSTPRIQNRQSHALPVMVHGNGVRDKFKQLMHQLHQRAQQ